ncbi:hypothetical protein ACHAXA_004135 [Cyclostephanos tholiformis]|uniref:Uncharacterized protein n=1 Tax=Cyclostephanos tholiformis TaxID=382380 RepID=A0ABD3SHM3_9STRA
MCDVPRKTTSFLHGDEQSSPWRRWSCANARDAISAFTHSESSDTRPTTATTTTTTVRGRRRLKSALYYFAFLTLLSHATRTTTTFMVVEAFSAGKNLSGLYQRKTEWIERSVRYYSTVMRKNYVGGGAAVTSAQKLRQPHETSSAVASVIPLDGSDRQLQLDKDFIGLATKHYYARVLIKMGKWDCAEKIYRRIIEELTDEAAISGGKDCDHAKLAVSTLLLALHVQRTGDVRATRSVFLRFFRRVALSDIDYGSDRDHKCSCSAKVLQAFALFEMKNGLSNKSLEIIRRAVDMDEGLRPVLEWKQFRDAAAGKTYSPTFRLRKLEEQ